MKTLEELNNKTWYRLVKVIYVFIFILLTTLTGYIIFNSTSTYKVSDYSVHCLYGNKSTFYAMQDKNILIKEEHYTPGLLSEIEREKLRDACAITKEDIDRGLSAIFLGTNDPKGPYKIEQVQLTKNNTTLAVMYLLASLVGWYLLSEIIKRTFYYVIFGNINPKIQRHE